MFFFTYPGHRLQDLHGSPPDDHGSFGACYHRDVERDEQSLGEPVVGVDASMVQHVVGRLHGPFFHSPLRHLIC